MKIRVLVLIIATLMLVLNAKAQTTCYFVGTYGNAWSYSDNWQGGIMPGIGDVAIINNDCVIDSHVEVQDLTVNLGILTLNFNTSSLTVTGNLQNNFHIYLIGGSQLICSTNSGGIYKIRLFHTPDVWHLISSPVTNATSGVFTGCELMPYNEATNSFGPYITQSSTPLTVGKGFTVRPPIGSSGNYEYSGSINNGTIGPIVLSLTGSPSNTTGWNLIGNPYPSAIDWNAATGWTKNNVGGTIYIWNNGQYATYNGTLGVNGGSQYIALGQGFFVQALASGANISMTKDVRKIVNGANILKESKAEPQSITLSVSGNNYSDEHVIAVKDSASETFDNQFDAYKWFGDVEAPQLYTYKENFMTAINSVDSLSKLIGKDIYVKVGATGNYTLNYSHDFTQGSLPRILDKQTQNIILPNSTYTFTATPLDDEDRFVFIAPDVSGVNDNAFNNKTSEILIYEANNMLNVFTVDENLISVDLFSLQGALVLQSYSKSTDMSTLSKGVYMVRVTTDKQMKMQKIFVK